MEAPFEVSLIHNILFILPYRWLSSSYTLPTHTASIPPTSLLIHVLPVLLLNPLSISFRLPTSTLATPYGVTTLLTHEIVC